MSNHIIITQADRRGDSVAIQGTVDGTPEQVTVWHSHLASLPNRAAKVTYVAQQLQAAYLANQTAAEDVLATIDLP